MSKTRKHKFAEYLQSHQRNLSARGVMQYSDSENLGIQVKTLNSDGDFVVKFSSSDPWIKPSEWLHNYKTAIKQRYEEARFVYQSLFPPEDTCAQNVEGKSVSERSLGSLMTGLNLREGSEFWRKSYPFDDQRAKEHLLATISRVPGWKRPDTILNYTLGEEFRSCVSVDDKLLEFIKTEVAKRDSN